MVNWVPGSPIDWAAMTPTASPMIDPRAAGQVSAVALNRRCTLTKGLAGQRGERIFTDSWITGLLDARALPPLSSIKVTAI